jgi:hypothetical protein
MFVPSLFLLRTKAGKRLSDFIVVSFAFTIGQLWLM